jgi:hypothetical protein
MNELSRRAASIVLAGAILTALGAELVEAQGVIVEKAMPAPIVETVPPPPALGSPGFRAIGFGAAANGSGSRATMSKAPCPPCRRSLQRRRLPGRRQFMFGCADIGCGKAIAGTGIRVFGSTRSAQAHSRPSRMPGPRFAKRTIARRNCTHIKPPDV